MSAVPVPDTSRRTQRDRIRLQGDVPSPINPPPACRFHTRCWKAQDICKTQEPPLLELAPGHQVACHFPENAPAQAQKAPRPRPTAATADATSPPDRAAGRPAALAGPVTRPWSRAASLDPWRATTTRTSPGPGSCWSASGVLVAVALVIGGVISVVALGAAKVTGLGDAHASATAPPSLYFPSDEPTTSPETYPDPNGSDEPSPPPSTRVAAARSRRRRPRRSACRRSRSRSRPTSGST